MNNVYPLNIAEAVTRLRAQSHCPGSLALAAAELHDGRGQGPRVSRALGISSTAWDRARVVLKLGSPKLIAQVRTGEVALATAWKQCLNKTRPAKIMLLGPRVEASQLGERIVDELDSALTAITGFPIPEDVASVLRHRHDFDRERVVRATNWLRRLADALDL